MEKRWQDINKIQISISSSEVPTRIFKIEHYGFYSRNKRSVLKNSPKENINYPIYIFLYRYFYYMTI
jgi:hypothetical protein